MRWPRKPLSDLSDRGFESSPLRQKKEPIMEKLITSEKIKDIVVINFIFNEINFEQREKIKIALSDLLQNEENKFIIDLSKVGFLSSLVAAVIVFFAKEVRRREGNVKLSGLSSEALSLFKITQLDRIFELYETKHDAIESFKEIQNG